MNKKTDFRRKVVCAAVRSNDGKVLAGTRHYSPDMVATMRLMGKEGERFRAKADRNQGFLDNFGNYLSRKEAYIVAVEAGQIKDGDGHRPGKLHSEDLY